MGPCLPFISGGTGPSPLFMHGGTGPSFPFMDGGVGPRSPFMCGGAGSSLLFMQPGMGPRSPFVVLCPHCCSCNLAWVLVHHLCYWALVAIGGCCCWALVALFMGGGGAPHWVLCAMVRGSSSSWSLSSLGGEGRESLFVCRCSSLFMGACGLKVVDGHGIRWLGGRQRGDGGEVMERGIVDDGGG